MGGAVTLADVRAFIAERLLGQDERRANGQLGSITLRPHQQSAVERLRSAVDEFGGALLCDQVGMGKTFAALALCGEDGACVVAPAVLKDMWQSAADSAGRTIEYTSTESLSRVRPDSMLPPTESVDQRLLIVDEAHHFRNPATKRFASLARVASKRRVLLLSATPIHNRKKDLTALVSLFLGSYAETLTQSEIGRLIVRREQSVLQDNGGFPNIEPPEWLELNHDDDIPRLLLGLPPPLPPRDGGDGGVLVIHSLLRQWSSSDAALERALTRRLQRGIALVAALESGTYPSQAELSAWNSAEDCVQLAFAELVASGSDSTQDLLPVVRTHADALSQLLRRIRAGTGADAERVDVIRAIRRKHCSTSVVAFSQYADTIDALFRHLASDGYVAALTGNGARVAGGRIARVDAIRRFAPLASGVSAPSASECVTLLLTTDLLSEGVNLQDAGVVVHIDLPWTPARMEQRLGRVARMGSRHERVYSYVIRPPASTEELIHLEYMLREKIKAAGIVVDDFPSLSHSLTRDSEEPVSTPCLTETIRSILEAWSLRRARGETREPMVAAVAAPVDGFLALCTVDGRPGLFTGDAEGVSDDPVRIVAAMRLCSGTDVPVDPGLANVAVQHMRRHFDGLEMTDGATSSPSARVRRAALKRIANIVSRSRPDERLRVASLGSCARTSLLSRIGADGERQLDALATAALSDEAWMRAISELGASTPTTSRREVLLAMIVFAKSVDTKA